MRATLTFLFGGGWWTPWYALHWLMLLPLWGFHGYFRDFKPGAGPQGGEAIVLFMILYGMVAIGIGMVNAALVMAMSDRAWWQRFLLWPLATFCMPVVAMFLGFAMVDAATDPDLTDEGRRNMTIALPVLILLCYGLNFWALATVRSRRSGPAPGARLALGG